MTTEVQASPRIQAALLRAFIASAFQAVGVSKDDAAGIAELMVASDLRGTDTHGVIRLPLYIRRIRGGGTNIKPNIRVVNEKPSAALVDGDNAMGHLVMRFAAQVAIEKAKKSGVGWVGARMSNHAGAAAPYAMMPLEHDMIGLYLASGSANHLPPWGSTELLLGTNPIAVAIPAHEEPPVVLDMSPAVAAFGKVRLKEQRGEQMPEGWMIDHQGKPLTDPKRAHDGLLLPIGEYKGYGLAMIIGMLAAMLNGAAFAGDIVDMNQDQSRSTNTGQSICAIAVDTFMPVDVFKREVDRHVRAFRNASRLPGVERVYIPGEQSHAKLQERLENGVPMPKPLRDTLDKVAQELGIAPLD